jgi:dTDP-4-amino-4,6-dideoxygalactose transaminase
MDALAEVARAHDLVLIEDCAQAHGTLYKRRPVGSLADVSAFSFYPTKNLGAAGDAGMVCSADEEIVATMRKLRNYGWTDQYLSQYHSTNQRMDELQAATLRVKLGHMGAWLSARRLIASSYGAALRDVCKVPSEAEWARHSWHLYVIEVPERDQLRSHLSARGIATAVHYPLPAHLQPPYLQFGGRAGSLPVTETQAMSALSLPLYPTLAKDDVESVIDGVSSYTRTHGCSLTT